MNAFGPVGKLLKPTPESKTEDSGSLVAGTKSRRLEYLLCPKEWIYGTNEVENSKNSDNWRDSTMTMDCDIILSTEYDILDIIQSKLRIVGTLDEHFEYTLGDV